MFHDIDFFFLRINNYFCRSLLIWDFSGIPSSCRHMGDSLVFSGHGTRGLGLSCHPMTRGVNFDSLVTGGICQVSPL